MKDLVNNFWFHLRLFFHLLSFNFQSQLAYKWDFLIGIIAVVTELSIRLIFLGIIYSYIPSLAGWTYPQMLFLFGTGFLLEALAWFTWRAGVLKLHLSIQDGSFDFLMTKPANLMFLTAFRRQDLEDVARVIVGITLITMSIQMSHIWPSLGQWAMWLVAFTLGEIVYFSFALLLKTTSFWTIQTAEINYVLYSLDRLNQYPVQIYTGLAKFVFSFIIPVAFITTVPAQLLAGKGGSFHLAGAIVFTAGIFLLCRFIFYRSIRMYSSASS